MRIIFFVGLTILAKYIYCQSPDRYLSQPALRDGSKLAMDFDAIGEWRRKMSVWLSSAVLSCDGRYCSYLTKSGNTILQSTEGEWKIELLGVRSGFFARNNGEYIYQVKDSLYFLSLGSSNKRIIGGVSSYVLANYDGRNEWVAVLLIDSSCILKNLLTGKERRFERVSTVSFLNSDWFCALQSGVELGVVCLRSGRSNRYKDVVNYSFDKSGRVLVLKTRKGEVNCLQWVNPLKGKVKEVWSAVDKTEQIGGYTMDESSNRLVFMVESMRGGKTDRSVWYYREHMEGAMERVSNSKANVETGLELTGVPGFNGDGRYIIFSLKKVAEPVRIAKADAVKVDVWHYRDQYLMSSQVSSRKHPQVKSWLKENEYLASVVSEGEGKVGRLTGVDEMIIGAIPHEYAIVRREPRTGRFWERGYAVSLVSLKDGTRRSLKKSIYSCFFPPGVGDWVLGYDGEKAQYVRYDIITDSYRSLSVTVPEWLGGEDEFCNVKGVRQYPEGTGSSGFIGWVTGGKSFLVYDYYDIWELDVEGRRPPVNVTGGYGRRHHIRLEVVGAGRRATAISRRERLLIAGFNMETKENGFFWVSLERPSTLEQLNMGPYLYYIDRSKYGNSSGGWEPLRARDAEVWLVQRQSAMEAPNLYVTRDLKTYRNLTHIQAPQGYNWLHTEMIAYRQQDGSKGTGVLYKPENFDANKKYPVLIHYYNQGSARLYEYLPPDYTGDAHINIPWFVSRGYLVFFPDIYFNKKSNGAAALNSVEGAASWLSRQAFVDSTKLGIAGHSFGGGLTNYILTHSNRFAAVFAGAGVSDWVSAQLQLSWDDGWPRLGLGDNRGDGIWMEPGQHIDNPILRADQVTSPLLMFHCRADNAVPFEQAVELFTALWRLGKKAWMLQYDEGRHSVIKPSDRQDLTVRVTQFFDHYLKGAPAPIWMTRGIDGRLKGIETGLEFDKEIKDP